MGPLKNNNWWGTPLFIWLLIHRTFSYWPIKTRGHLASSQNLLYLLWNILKELQVQQLVKEKGTSIALLSFLVFQTFVPQNLENLLIINIPFFECELMRLPLSILVRDRRNRCLVRKKHPLSCCKNRPTICRVHDYNLSVSLKLREWWWSQSDKANFFLPCSVSSIQQTVIHVNG